MRSRDAPDGTDRLTAPARLVVDANVLVAAFLRDSTVRRILSLSLIEFLAPEFLFEEVEAHLQELRRRAGLSKSAATELLKALTRNLGVVSEASVRAAWSEAVGVMASIDPRDTAYVAAALAVPCDGIWSDDAHLKAQRLVPTWTTAELIAALRADGLAL